MIKNTLLTIVCLVASMLLGSVSAQENIYVYKKGEVIFTEKTNDLDSVALESAKTKLVFYKERTATFTANLSDVDSITFTAPGMPVADILDVVFKMDGTAVDVSPMKNTVQLLAGSKTMTYYNEALGRYVAWFDHTPGNEAGSGFYKIDFENNAAFRNALSDGHTLELLFMYNDNLPIAKEVKPFSAMQAGGTGFLLSNNPNGNDSKMNFIAHINGGWHYAYGGVRPTKGTYYHVVGTWDKANNQSKIYINGELRAKANITGNLKLPNAGSNWFCIGGDATPSGNKKAEAAWRGDVAIARVYNDPLTDAAAAELWNAVKEKMPSSSISVNDIYLLSNASVPTGSKYTILGKGFKSGDKVRFVSTTDEKKVYTLNASFLTAGALSVQITEEITSDEYKLFAVRGQDIAPLGTVNLTTGANVTPTKRPRITAHRGYWKSGVPQNSIAGFKAAYELGVYDSETDFWLSKDNYIVCNHDQSIQGKDIPSSNYVGDLENVKLTNGEALPTLQSYLDVMKSEAYKDSDMKLLIELKPNSNALANAIVAAVNAAGLNDKVEYIAFSYALCQHLTTIVPEGTLIGYNNGDKHPNDYAKGINCMNYHIDIIRNNPSWVEDAHNKGMEVSVWTLGDSPNDYIEFINRGVDCLSSDFPQIVKQMVDLLFTE